MTPAGLRSRLAPVIAAHVALKRALGRRFIEEAHMLRDLDAFLGPGCDLDADSFMAWCRTGLHRATGVQRTRMRVVRNLCLYRQRSEPDCFVPDRAMFPPHHQPRRPQIFRDDEIRRMFEALPRIGRRASPLRREHARLALTLFCSAGLRLAEVGRLVAGDYNRALVLPETVSIRASRFSGSDGATVEWDAGPDVLIDNGARASGTLYGDDVLRIWDVRLEKDTTYTFSLGTFGADEIVIHPFFLAPGRHWAEDLPRLAREGAARHRNMSIRVGPPLGLHPRLVDAVLERIGESP
jgi:hypothetical protein